MKSSFWPEFNLTFEEVVSFTEEDETILNRSSIILDTTKEFSDDITANIGMRYNATSNIAHFALTRPIGDDPVRSDEFEFANNPFNLDTAYLAYQPKRKDIKFLIMGGYLEELYAGVGGEVLYDPQNSSWELGAEMWQAFKRDPFSGLATRVISNDTTTGFVNVGYDIADTNLKAKLSLGRYLAGDTGGTLALNSAFDNGAEIEGFVTLTNQRDRGILNEDEDYYAGLKVKFPFNLPYTNLFDDVCCDANVNVRPFTRDAGQQLQKPISLF